MSEQTDILIVTATEVESRAMLTAFAQRSGQPARPLAAGDRVYHDLGRIADRRAMLALCEMGTAGPGASLLSVQKAIAALSPAAVVLAGIAFGVDERKQQVGDLLVSLQLLLYESQRVGATELTARGDRPHASTRLINALRNGALSWPEDGARVRFGLMLSGEKLVDNSDYRGQLLQLSADIIGGEMEGAGLYAACADAKVDWIIVKAICDFADGNKAVDKETRQMIAARNAAAFVVHAMDFMPASTGGETHLGNPSSNAERLAEPASSDGFDCFLSHNSRDKPAVRELARQLGERGISVWLDEQQLRPGMPWQSLLESGIHASRSVAVLVGADGFGPWENVEMRAALSLAINDGRPVIPVVLANAPAIPDLPLFLQGHTWVDMRIARDASTSSALDLLIWGITGKQPWESAPMPTPGFSRQQPPSGAGRPQRQLLSECINTVLATEDQLRSVCFEHFPEVYRNLREIDRRSHITRELIDHVLARGQSDKLWQLLHELNAACVAKYREVGR